MNSRTKAYVVYYWTDYNENRINGVYTTEEKAIEVVNELNKGFFKGKWRFEAIYLDEECDL